MITLFHIWEQMQGGLNAHQNGFIRPNRNLVNWVNVISQDIFNDLIDQFEKSQVISDLLMPFTITKNIVVPRTTGQAFDIIKLPADYRNFGSARAYHRGGEACGKCDVETLDGANGTDQATCPYMDEDEIEAAQQASDDKLCEIHIDKIHNNKWGAICNRKTLKPSLADNKAYCTQYDKGLKLIPKGVGVVVLDYFRQPKDGTFDYTVTNPGAEDEYLQYNAATSQPLEWDIKALPEFMARLEKKYGKAISNPQMVQGGENDSKI